MSLATIEEQNESKFIVWTEDREGNVQAELKNTRRAAKIAYGKIERGDNAKYKEFGWAFANTAYPRERAAAGLKPFPSIHVPL